MRFACNDNLENLTCNFLYIFFLFALRLNRPMQIHFKSFLIIINHSQILFIYTCTKATLMNPFINLWHRLYTISLFVFLLFFYFLCHLLLFPRLSLAIVLYGVGMKKAYYSTLKHRRRHNNMLVMFSFVQCLFQV